MIKKLVNDEQILFKNLDAIITDEDKNIMSFGMIPVVLLGCLVNNILQMYCEKAYNMGYDEAKEALKHIKKEVKQELEHDISLLLMNRYCRV